MRPTTQPDLPRRRDRGGAASHRTARSTTTGSCRAGAIRSSTSPLPPLERWSGGPGRGGRRFPGDEGRGGYWTGCLDRDEGAARGGLLIGGSVASSGPCPSARPARRLAGSRVPTPTRLPLAAASAPSGPWSARGCLLGRKAVDRGGARIFAKLTFTA